MSDEQFTAVVETFANLKKGYGEENDWSMRARQIGYKNIIVPNLFVYHKHGGSFSHVEKNKSKSHSHYSFKKIVILLQPDLAEVLRENFNLGI